MAAPGAARHRDLPGG